MTNIVRDEINTKAYIGFGEREPSEFDCLAIYDMHPVERSDAGPVEPFIEIIDIEITQDSKRGEAKQVSIHWLMEADQIERIESEIKADLEAQPADEPDYEHYNTEDFNPQFLR